jgi:hypothetical protein
VISTTISVISAALLSSGGATLLFASDVLLPRLVPGVPSSAAWLGQMIGAAWLSVALYNWTSRATILGGIYGRLAVNLNLVLYSVSALALLKANNPTLAIRLVTAPMLIMAAVYGVILFRGPFDRSSNQ